MKEIKYIIYTVSTFVIPFYYSSETVINYGSVSGSATVSEIYAGKYCVYICRCVLHSVSKPVLKPVINWRH